jgi:hypothetical protein
MLCHSLSCPIVLSGRNSRKDCTRVSDERCLQSETRFADDSSDESVGDGAFVERDHEFPGMVITESLNYLCLYHVKPRRSDFHLEN